MIIREVFPQEKQMFNNFAVHPLQSWEWGEFREKTGVKPVRLGIFERQEMKGSFQLTIHPVPKLNRNIVYFPKGPAPSQMMIEALRKLGQENSALFVKLEPNINCPVDSDKRELTKVRRFLKDAGCKVGRSLFTPYTFILDLRPTEEELISQMKEKTRYNVRLAFKKGVRVVEDNSGKAFDEYLRLMKETTKRQQFYAHGEDYHRKMWEVLQPAGIAHLFLAIHEEKILAAWIVFNFNGVLYYPYGASSRENREVMASYALAWEVIRFGKKLGCTSFDLWGSLGSKPEIKHPWYGWHRFKEGLGAKIYEFVGTYDLPTDYGLYPLARIADEWRWKWLRLKAKFSR